MDQPVNIKEITLDEFNNINKNEIEFISLKDGSLAQVIDENNINSKKNEQKIVHFEKIGEKQYEYETQQEILPSKIQQNNNIIYKISENNNVFNKNIIKTNNNKTSNGNIVEDRKNYRLFVSGADYIEKNSSENNTKFSVINEVEETNYQINNQTNNEFSNENNLNNYKFRGKQQGILKSQSPRSKKIQFYRVINFSNVNLINNYINTKNLNEFNNTEINNNNSINKSVALDKKDSQTNYDYQDEFKPNSSLEEKNNSNYPLQLDLIKEDNNLDDFRGSNSMKVIVERTKKKKKSTLKKQPEFLDNYGYFEVKGDGPKRFKKYL